MSYAILGALKNFKKYFFCNIGRVPKILKNILTSVKGQGRLNLKHVLSRKAINIVYMLSVVQAYVKVLSYMYISEGATM